MAILDIFDGLLSAQGAAAMGVGAGAGILVVKKVEHSPNLQAKISNLTAKAGGQVSNIKAKVHPDKPSTDPDVEALMELIGTLPPEQQKAAMAFVAQTQKTG